MKRADFFSKVGHAVIAAFCAFTLALPQSVLACMGSSGPVCTINPTACLKSMVLTKSVPGPIFPIPPAGTGTLLVSVNLFITCPITNNCGSTCSNVAAPVAASINVTLNPPAPPACPAGSPSLPATISTAAGTMALPACSASGVFNAYSVAVSVPGGTCPGLYSVVGTASVTFSDGTVLNQTGDTVICLVPEAPGQPGVPRLDMQLLTPGFPRMAPGDQHIARYLVKNNDPSNSVTLVAFATSKQNALRPQGGNEAQGVFAISSPFGDDFPIQFNANSNICIPLPLHPYTQPTISISLPVIPPGGTNIVTVGIRSYGQCASGSCSESTLRVQGTFSDNTPAFACAGMAVSADSSVPSQSCALQVNDCNHNGIPDALDISSRRSSDQNFNAMPDECETFINVPYFSSVTPSTAPSGAPIQVQVAFNEVVSNANVWANGNPLIRTQFFGSPLWYGTIPADTRPGPQTVYFLGRDQVGGLSSYIATYNTRPAPVKITAVEVISNSVALTWTRGLGPYVVQRSGSLLSSNWTDVEFTPNTSAYVGVAGSAAFYRVADSATAPVADANRDKYQGTCAANSKPVVIVVTGGTSKTVNHPKNVGTCQIHLFEIDAKGQEIAGNSVDIASGGQIQSYTSTAPDSRAIVFTCPIVHVNPSCLLEIDH